MAINEPEITSRELMRGKINSETARIPWKELQRYFAGGYTLIVDFELDLVEVACQFEQDNAQQIEHWLNADLIRQVSNQQAREWYNNDAILWACVVQPWVLIQPAD
jgi:hypothetical protein